ncbi:gluconolaconase [Bradyrhizobium sp. S69]|uniref:gluconolaconase n=1 Tax=Bradyrhizobium sp. S69 TaxID=1641856 RepID=UPI00131AFF7D|nr:gluconolaconase [Bradyrhizobium sp. S69]
MIIRSILASVATSAMLSCSAAAFAEPISHPPQIAFTANVTYPETASWSAKHRAFFVSSVRHGTVGKVTLDGKYMPFVADDKLVSTVGLLADDAHNTLWVTNSDPGAGDRTNAATQGKLAGVAAYDETTGERRAYYDLGSLSPGSHFANDVSVDDAGNVYVTDSFSPTIFRIGSDGKASIFAQNVLFGEGNGFNLNGIAWHNDGFLIVGRYNSGELFRVNIADPTKVDKVEVSEVLKGADGFRLVDNQHLVVVQNLGVDRTVELVSTDGWKSAKVVRQLKSVMSMPSSATQMGKDVYVLNSRIDTLFDPKATKVSDFVLQKF